MKPVKKQLQKTLQSDPHGDTTALQMNPQEAAMVSSLLKQLGGAGVENPKTGLLQFYEDAGGSGRAGNVGQGGHNDLGGSNRGSGGEGGNRGGNYNGTGHGLPNGQMTIGGPARNYGDPYGPNSPTGQALATHGLDPAHVAAALGSQKGYVDASRAYANRTGLQRFGDALLGAIPGFGTVKPTLGDPNTYAGGTYHNNLNPAGLVGGLLGTASGFPGAGFLGEHLAGGIYNGVGGNNYSFGGAGVDPQTGVSTGSGWSGGGNMFGGGIGGGVPGNQSPGMGSNSNPTLANVQSQTAQAASPANTQGNTQSAVAQLMSQYYQPQQVAPKVPGLMDYSQWAPGYNYPWYAA